MMAASGFRYVIGVARMKNWGQPKMDEWSEWPHFWFYLYGFKIKECISNVYT